MIPPFAWVGELVPFFLRWGHKSQHVCHNVHKKLLVRSLFYTCIYFELTKHLGCGFKVIFILCIGSFLCLAVCCCKHFILYSNTGGNAVVDMVFEREERQDSAIFGF